MNLEVAVAEIRGDVKSILVMMAERERFNANRDESIEDHEVRLRSMERTFTLREGARIAIAAIAGFIASIYPFNS